jgi:hypothetical protein
MNQALYAHINNKRKKKENLEFRETGSPTLPHFAA